MRVALRVDNGKYAGLLHAGSAWIVPDINAIGPLTTFTLTHRGNDTVTLQATNGKYFSAENGGGARVMASRDEFGAWETFRLINSANGMIALQASNGQYVTHLGRGLRATSDKIGIWEEFELVVIGHEAWMEAHYNRIKDKTLAQLCLPGTHDSGTYELFDIIAPDATDVIRELWKNRMGEATGIGAFIKAMAVCQTKTFYEQLRAGIRYIDLRICVMPNEFGRRELYTCHTLRGNLISVLMNDVRRFLDENPREVVVFKVGFKSMDADEIARGWDELRASVSRYFYRPEKISDLLGLRFSELVDDAAPKRAIFLMPGTDIFGIYDSKITTNAGVIANLREKTTNFPGGNLLEAQFIRPISDDDYFRGFIQKHGCRILPILPMLQVLPFVGTLLAGIGIAAMPSYLLYVRNFDPRPTDLLQNARDSRSILREYIRWLEANPSIKPQLVMADFIEEVPMVEIAIRISTGASSANLLDGINDITPHPPNGDRMVVFECTASAIAATFQAAGYAAEAAGEALRKYMPGLTADLFAGALKAAGFLLNEVGRAVQAAYNLLSGPLNHVLRAVGYAGKEIVRFFNGLGGQFKRFFDDLGRKLNPLNWGRAFSIDSSTPVGAFLERLTDDEFRDGLLSDLADVAPGDLDAVARIAGTMGYVFSAEELAQVVPEGVF